MPDLSALDLRGHLQGAKAGVHQHVTGTVGAFVGWATAGRTDEPVEPVWPALAALLLAFVVARSFASVYECVVDTLFVCAMRDKDEYGGNHMSDALRDSLGLAESGARASEADVPRGSEDTKHV